MHTERNCPAIKIIWKYLNMELPRAMSIEETPGALFLCPLIQQKVSLEDLILWQQRSICAWQLQRWMGEVLQFINIIKIHLQFFLKKISLLTHWLFVLTSISPYFPSYPRKMLLCKNSSNSMRNLITWGEFVPFKVSK